MKALYLMVVTTLLLSALLAGSAQAKDKPGKPNNWGKWGKNDERGAANYITAKEVKRAAKLIKNGKVFSLAIPLDNLGPVYPGRVPPQHFMVATGADYAAGQANLIGKMKFADDYIYMPLQGSTQWDALSHAWYGETLYNGVDQQMIKTAPAAGGASKLGIENVKTSFVGRAVLIDVLAYKGGSLPPGYVITRKDIEQTLKSQKSKVRKGDMVLIRTGFVPDYYKLTDPMKRMAYVAGPHTGIGPDVVAWVDKMQISGIAADNIAMEVLPNPDPEKSLSIHGSLLRDLGVYIGEIWWLEELSADCAEDGRYEFFLAAQPLNIPGAVGSPLNPIAIK
jgi:kynurenine formamidase